MTTTDLLHLHQTTAQVEELGVVARQAAQAMKTVLTETKNKALRETALALRAKTEEILTANQQDLQEAASHNLTLAQVDRLRLDAARVDAMAKGLEIVAELPDPVGECTAEWTVPNGLRMTRVRVPLGVIGVIYESRPNVTADAAALCLKAGNACILRPGAESFQTSRVIADVFAQTLKSVGLPAAVQMIPTTDRAAVGALLQLQDYVDVIIPRGGKSLIARVQEESRVPVLAHLDGNCHVYIDGDANLDMAVNVTLNAKMRRTGICGAAETLLVDQRCAATHLKPLVEALLTKGCEVRGDESVQKVDPRVRPATEEDWATEYLDAIMSVKLVNGVSEAVHHIERYGSHHTDAIITEDATIAAQFQREVDSAIVLHNASTQFADGGEFGMGAEIGIATGRLHARGPVGLEQLT
ncbi:MAG: glutamate-5-semialdehyde dehydrogenase, partial [Alphaproteobacteria bacterium]|nr:glutamate-5-semialdehyde dehydrogenase [Alphaproteobacteria bacterium]